MNVRQFVWFLIIKIIHNKKLEGRELGTRKRRLDTHQPQNELRSDEKERTEWLLKACLPSLRQGWCYKLLSTAALNDFV